MIRAFWLDGLHAHYDKSHILHGVSMKIAAGEIVSLLGRNGSGRSTTLKTIMGLVQPTGGRVVLEGSDLAGQRAFRIARAGIAYVPEEREIFAKRHGRREYAYRHAANTCRRAVMDHEHMYCIRSAIAGPAQHRSRHAVGG